MEKVRFEAFNVEELRVLRRACYEAGAAFGDPGHTAAERETLDDLAVEILGELKKKEAAAARQTQKEPLEKTMAKAVEDSVKEVVETGCHLNRRRSSAPHRIKNALYSGRTFPPW